MAEHTNAAILKAYADNTDLVIFILDSNYKWIRTNPKALMDYPDDEFFACLPKHESPCLHWLNGGDIEFQSAPDWFVYSADYNESYVWSLAIVFMDKTYYLRVKPRKEKLWIAVKTDKHETLGGCRNVRICSHAFVNKQDAIDYLDLDSSQLVEIEVEV